MKIEERLTKRSPDDLIYIGGLIQNVMKTEFWTVLGLLSSSLRIEEIEKSKNGLGASINADRVLGRIEAYETLVTSLEAFASMREELLKPISKQKKSVDEGADEAIQTDDLYEPSLNYGGAV